MNESAANMADVLNECLKCKRSLSSSDRPSKLLPCLHTMCEECISGRTDVAERMKRLKEERERSASAKKMKEENIEKSNETVHEEKAENETKVESEIVKNDEVEETALEDEDVDEDVAAKDNEKTEAVDENEDEENVNKPADSSDKRPVESETSDVNKTANENKEDHDGDAATSNNLKADADDGVNSSATGQPHDTEEEEKEEDGSKVDDQPATDVDVGEQKPNDEKENENETNQKPTSLSEEKQSEETQQAEQPMEGVEEVPPDPVPLTECPVCREPFSPEVLIENIFIRKQAATSEDGEGKEQMCTGCESNPSTSFCLQCDDWLCADCVNAHKRVRMTKDHQLTSLEEAMANKEGSGGAPAEVSMLCRVHPKEKLTLFCEKCEVLTCRDCQLLQHQEHKYQFLQEAADSYKAKLTGSLSLMKERRDVLKRYQTEIEERLHKVKREKNDLQQDILRQADIIVKAVRAAVWSVLSSLHSFTDAAAKRLSREVGDVGALVGKFDHCISFMDGILEDGFGLPLLFSKTIVETKCRKVYHTPMEPQSLKGQLNIQYRHDVPSVLRSLPHIGAIYVNGSKYPPEKSSSQSSSSSSGSQSSMQYRDRGNSGQSSAVVGGVSQSQGIPHHLAPQERSLYMQMMMSRQSHANTAPSQGPTLSLPGSRRVQGMPPAGPRGWPGQQLGLAGSQGGLMVGMMSQGQSGQHQMMARAPTFTPMRLHHRPVDPVSMVMGSQHRPPHSSSHVVGFASLPAPPPLRSPVGQPQPQYRGAAEGLHMNSGGQAAMSGIRRPPAMMDNSPDPARPASGGHNTPERPLSSEGAASSIRVKSEMLDSTDCVITSANFKIKKSVLPNTSLGELQKNLDEVIRGVPLDLGDNLEQINGGDSSSLGSSGDVRTTAPPPTFVSSPTSTAATTTTTLSSSTIVKTSQASPKPTDVTNGGGDNRAGGETVAPVGAMEHGGAEGETDGRQVKGYVTGNSMPGFTLAAVESVDPNDDYCAACHQGGDVLCCDQCPRVFHLQCHVPLLSIVPSGTFVCTLCDEGVITEGQEDGSPETAGKRKATSGLSDKDRKVCERVLLELICHPSSIPFHEPVSRAVPNYYKIITNPMDFSSVKSKLAPGHFEHYCSVEAFLDDCKLVFKNCAVYNSETSEVGKAGKIVRGLFDRLVERHMRQLAAYSKLQHDSLDSESRLDPERKRRRLTPSPHTSHEESLAPPVVQLHGH